ncbi:hypothetical protein Bca4012_088984 [Brassica carinata]
MSFPSMVLQAPVVKSRRRSLQPGSGEEPGGLKGRACEDLKVSPENGKNLKKEGGNHWSKSETGKEPLVKDLSRFSCPGEKSPLSVPTRITV